MSLTFALLGMAAKSLVGKAVFESVKHGHVTGGVVKAADFAYGNGDGVVNLEDATYNVEQAGEFLSSAGEHAGSILETICDFFTS